MTAAFVDVPSPIAGAARIEGVVAKWMSAILWMMLLAPVGLAQEPLHSAEETSLLQANARQRDAVASVDLDAIAEIAHPNLRVNAPTNRVITREDLILMVGSGEIRNEVFERIPEVVTITGDVGVVMGREIVRPAATSEQARMYGAEILNRRYTNVYLRQDGEWRHLARHANIVPATMR